MRHAPLVVIVMENELYQHIVGSPNAPFINQTMIPGGMLDTNYFAVPGSLPDYLLMVSGRTAPPASAANLFSALGKTTSWREFMESMPSVCYRGRSYRAVHGTRAGLYARGHNPAVYFTSVTNTSLCKNVVPLDRSHFSRTSLPAFSLVVPNECNDSHTLPTNGQCPMWNGSTNRASNAIKMGDNWLASFVPAVAHVATVIVTWDEGALSNEHIATIAYGVGVHHGRDSRAYGHSSLEAGLYRYFALGTPPGRGAKATPLPIP
ncbi:MAG: hypothetical protein ACLPUO_28210 [Streptosporangiaceae bacterium]